jgi:hypothetical protein
MSAKPKLKMTEDINIDLMEYIKMNQKTKQKRVQSEEQRAKSIEALKKAREAKIAKKRQPVIDDKPKVEEPKVEVKAETPKVEAKVEAPKAMSSDMNSELLKGIYDLLKSQQELKKEPAQTPKPVQVAQPPTQKPAQVAQPPKPTPAQAPKPAPVIQPPKPVQVSVISNYRKPLW